MTNTPEGPRPGAPAEPVHAILCGVFTTGLESSCDCRPAAAPSEALTDEERAECVRWLVWLESFASDDKARMLGRLLASEAHWRAEAEAQRLAHDTILGDWQQAAERLHETRAALAHARAERDAARAALLYLMDATRTTLIDLRANGHGVFEISELRASAAPEGDRP